MNYPANILHLPKAMQISSLFVLTCASRSFYRFFCCLQSLRPLFWDPRIIISHQSSEAHIRTGVAAFAAMILEVGVGLLILARAASWIEAAWGLVASRVISVEHDGRLFLYISHAFCFAFGAGSEFKLNSEVVHADPHAGNLIITNENQAAINFHVASFWLLRVAKVYLATSELEVMNGRFVSWTLEW